MGLNRQDIYKKRQGLEEIFYCTAHNRFQDTKGNWHDAQYQKEALNNHIIHTGSQDAHIQETICDYCQDPAQRNFDL